MRSIFLLTIVSILASSISAQTTQPSTGYTPTTRPINERMPKDAKLPTLWIIGDSTVRNGTRNQQGWGDPIADFFDPAKINVVNRARGGRSSRTFHTEGLWEDVLKNAKPGDFVIMQLGHNDGGALAGDNRERGTIKGIGEETEEVTLTLGDNKDKKYTVHTYGWYMRKYITDAQEKGMTPIVCSPVPRVPKEKLSDELPTPGGYWLWSQQVAEQAKVDYIDLQRIILGKYVGMEPADIKAKWFTEADGTHTSPEGAKLNASCVVEGLKQLKDNKLVEYLKP